MSWKVLPVNLRNAQCCFKATCPRGPGGHGVLVGVTQRVLGGAVVGCQGGDSSLEGPQCVALWPPGLSSQLWRTGLGPFLSFPWFV